MKDFFDSKFSSLCEFNKEQRRGFSFSFMMAPQAPEVFDNLTRENIRRAVRSNAVDAEKYILLYLYDPEKEKISERLLQDYGAALNNRLQAAIPLFTVYTKAAFNLWRSGLSDSARKILEEQFNHQTNTPPRYELLRKLAKDYRVADRLPALVVIDTQAQGMYAEAFTSVSFCRCPSEVQIYEKILTVLDAIDKHYNDFDAIRKVCDGTIKRGIRDLSDRYEQADPMSLYNFLDKMIRKAGETKSDCADRVGISRNTLSNYMYLKTRIKLENAFALALHLRMSTEELDWIICNYSDANPQEIDDWKRQSTPRIRAVIHCLESGMNDVEANIYLDNQQLPLVGSPLE